jgi:hypothetical protein
VPAKEKRKVYPFFEKWCSSSPSVVYFGKRVVRAEGRDLWSDRRFVCACHVSGLWIGAMMAMKQRYHDLVSRGGFLTVRSKRRFAFPLDEIWNVGSFKSKALDSVNVPDEEMRLFTECRQLFGVSLINMKRE